MSKMGLTFALVMVATIVMTSAESHAQKRFFGKRGSVPVYSGTDASGMTLTNYSERIKFLRTLKMASHNPNYSPAPLYTYSNPGVQAGLTHQWNQGESLSRPWNGDFAHWRWREPTALVVPPTSAYQTSYGWGVGQVRSTPIHHQFGLGGAGSISGGGGFTQTPYAPSNTGQFGVYPVRAPW